MKKISVLLILAMIVFSGCLSVSPRSDDVSAETKLRQRKIDLKTSGEPIAIRPLLHLIVHGAECSLTFSAQYPKKNVIVRSDLINSDLDMSIVVVRKC